MAERDLAAVWSVLQTEGADEKDSISVVDSGVTVKAGVVKLGVDPAGSRHLLIPLLPGEAFAPDRSGHSVHLRRIRHGKVDYLSAVCLHEQLNKVFAQFAWELLSDISTSNSPARTTVESLARWRQLFADAAHSGELSINRVIGLLAELVVLEEILAFDPGRDVRVWTGPQSAGAEHDFRHDTNAIEVKATLRREGRLVGISSVDQLDPPPSGTLHMVHYRFEPDPSGLSLPEVVSRVRQLSPDLTEFDHRVSAAGYQQRHDEYYSSLRYSVVDRRTYDVEAAGFPRIIPSSFSDGTAPPGTLHITYSIDLTNEPPHPVDSETHSKLIKKMSGSS